MQKIIISSIIVIAILAVVFFSFWGIKNSEEIVLPPAREHYVVIGVEGYNVRTKVDSPIPQELFKDVTSEEGGILAWVETDKEEKKYQYERRVDASNEESEEKINWWELPEYKLHDDEVSK